MTEEALTGIQTPLEQFPVDYFLFGERESIKEKSGGRRMVWPQGNEKNQGWNDWKSY